MAPDKAVDIYMSVQRGNYEELERLCKNVKNPKQLDFPIRGITALSLAVQMNDLKCVDILIRHGASVNARSKDTNDRIEPPIVTACRQGFASIMYFLAENNADLNGKDFYGHTALWMATKQLRLDFVQYLINNGAIINTAENWGECPLYLAAKYLAYKGRREMLQLLVQCGINAHHEDHEGRNALYWIMLNQDKELFRFVVHSGVNLKPWPWLTRKPLPVDLVEDEEFMCWIRDELATPPSLQRFCRIAIRRQLIKCTFGRDIRWNIARLPLPDAIIRYLQLERM